jgi:hypothetical protein
LQRIQSSKLEDVTCTKDEFPSVAIEGIATVLEEDDGKKHTTIQLCEGIGRKTFVRVLEFLYTGEHSEISEKQRERKRERERERERWGGLYSINDISILI